MLRKTTKTATQLGLPAGDAVLRDGKVTILPPGHSLDQPRQTDIGPYVPAPAATSHIEINGTYQDRARGFRIKTTPLTWAFMAGSGLVAYFGQGVPLMSAAMIGYMFTGFCVSWVFAWLVDTVISPDGNVLYQTHLAARWLAREQRHRHEQRGQQ